MCRTWGLVGWAGGGAVGVRAGEDCQKRFLLVQVGRWSVGREMAGIKKVSLWVEKLLPLGGWFMAVACGDVTGTKPTPAPTPAPASPAAVSATSGNVVPAANRGESR